MRIVYTACFGSYDSITDLPDSARSDDIRYVCITNQAINLDDSSGWEFIYWDNLDFSNSEMNRFCKFFPDKFFGDVSVETIYLDGNVEVLQSLEGLFNIYSDVDIGFSRHFLRSSVEEEINACSRAGHSLWFNFSKYKKIYKNQTNGSIYLPECNVIYRKNTLGVRSFCASWWFIYMVGINRDQLSVTYLLQNSCCTYSVSKVNDQRVCNIYLKTGGEHNFRFRFKQRLISWCNRVFSSLNCFLD